MTDERNLLNISVAPSVEGAREARTQLSAALTRWGVDKKLCDGMRLATSEWIANLSQHPTLPPKEIDVSLLRIGHTLILEIKDDGSPFDKFQEIIWNETLPLELNESGMGLRMITHYFKVMTYAPSRVGNSFCIQSFLKNGSIQKKILLVDDDPVALKLYGEFLSNSYQVLFATSTDVALQILDRSSVDLIVSDINMPGGESGLELCARVRNNKILTTVPFIFLSSETNKKTLKAASGLAIDDYLVKPVRKSVLLMCAERVIHNAQFIRNRLGDRFDENLTRLLFPSLPQTLGAFKTSVWSKPAEAGGGDLLFHRRLGTGTLIVLADLMGHGSQAKFYSHAMTGYLSGMLSALHTVSPQKVLQQLNQAFHDDLQLSQTIATAIAIQIFDNGLVQVSNAGQPEPLMISETGTQHIPVSGALLGLNSEQNFDTYEITLGNNQRLCLYTDGMAELGLTPENHAENFETITTMFQETADLPLKEVTLKIENLIEHIHPADLEDDLTFLILEYIS